MAISRRKEFREYIPVEGTCEVQQLASTYNEMLDDIQNYIGELLDTQRAQRKAEIKALQMQINPHYIYNTLASIKWLVYQNDTEKQRARLMHLSACCAIRSATRTKWFLWNRSWSTLKIIF